MLERRTFVFTAVGAAMLAVPLLSAALAAAQTPFSDEAFQKAQAAGKPILVEVHAAWCPTCKAQQPILAELTAQPRFKNMAVFRLDFDGQKAQLRKLGGQSQSTLIVFKGAKEVGRSVGDTRRESIAALLDKAL